MTESHGPAAPSPTLQSGPTEALRLKRSAVTGARFSVGTWDAVIVGAGPAGSALAIRLARAGHAVLLLDRARFPRDKPCSEYLSPGTVGALDELGVLDRVLDARPARLTGMRVAGPDGTVMEGRYVSSHAYPPPVPFALSLPRRTLDQILRDAAGAAGAEVREGVAVEELVYERGA